MCASGFLEERGIAIGNDGVDGPVAAALRAARHAGLDAQAPSLLASRVMPDAMLEWGWKAAAAVGSAVEPVD